ncbi:hypothetical protein Rcae01_00523 [Novipirellula caenicola]|uniref:Uncharacterized protein n=1 Tax=Novipirellula caenicola TaxID=1536901 RepID=A0ABP9VIR1_9BACT
MQTTSPERWLGRGRTGPVGLVRVRADRAIELALDRWLARTALTRAIAGGSARPLPNVVWERWHAAIHLSRALA